MQIQFLDAEGTEIGVLKSHDVAEDSVVTSYTVSSSEESEILQSSEMIIGAKINQDHKGANTSIQFLIAQRDPALRKKGLCGWAKRLKLKAWSLQITFQELFKDFKFQI